MKRCLSWCLVMMIVLNSSVVLGEQAESSDVSNNFWGNAQNWLGNAWDSTQSAVGNAMNTAGDAIGDAVNAAGDAIGDAWSSISSFTVETWNKAGAYLGEKSDEMSIWFSISGNNALERI